MTNASGDTPTHDERTEPALRSRRVLTWIDAWWPLVLVVLGLAVLRAAYLIWLSPFTLVEDEAHYWEWSRYLDWSYYSKGPGVAWMIALSTAAFGDTAWAVRLPAVIFGALGTAAVAGLAFDVYRDRRVALLAALAYQAMPGVQITSFLMTIDGPYLACWALACWAAWRALTAGSRLAWVALGLALAAGFLFKYTILLLPPGILLFALIQRRNLRIAGPKWILAGVATALLGLVPVLIWNAGQDWPTVRHLMGHLGMKGGDVAIEPEAGPGYDPFWTIGYFVNNLGIAGAIFPLSILGIINTWRARRRGPAGWRAGGPAFLICAAAPIALFYLGVTFVTNTEANWAIAAFVTLCALCGWTALDGVHRVDHPIRFTWNAGLITIVLLLVAVPVLGWRSGHVERPLGVPVHRISGAETLAAATEEQIDALRAQTGLDPFVMTVHYGRASLLSFYLDGRPTVYAASAHMGGGRRSQYDVWPHTDLARTEVNDKLRGRPAVLFGGADANWAPLFERVEEIGPLPGESKSDRTTFVGYGFLGFDVRDAERAGRGAAREDG